MEIDRETLMTQATLILFIVAMIGSTYLPSPWNMVAVFGTYAGVLGYMTLSRYYLQYKLSEYVALEAIIVGQTDERHFTRQLFLVKSMETVSGRNYVNLTLLRLAEPYKDPEGGRTKEIYIIHAGNLTERLTLRPGKAYYKGTPINHSQLEHVILARDPKGYVSRAKLYPMFHLISTCGDADWYLSKQLEVMGVATRR